MVYSGIYFLPKSNSTTVRSEQTNQANVNNENVSNHLKHGNNSKKLSSTGSTSNRSSESSRFNETNSNVTIKSDLNKFNKTPKLAPEIIFLIKEHAKTLETINQISKKLQEIELKVDDISQRLSKENSLNCSNGYHKQMNGQNDRTTTSDSTQQTKNNHLKIDSSHNQKELNQTRLHYSTYKDVDHLSNHLSNNNLSNNANITNIPTNQILSDDSGGEYGNKTTTKTVSDDDELLSILDKITKCSHHILQTQQAYQQQGTAIYNSLSKPYAYSQQNQSVSNQFSQQSGLHTTANQLTSSHNLPGRQYILDVYPPPPPQQHLYPAINPYLLNAKSPIKSTNQSNIHQQQQTIVPTIQFSQAPIQQQTASLNELLFEPNVERFLSNLDQLVSNDETNLAAILGTNQQQPNMINSINLPMLQHSQNQQFIAVSPLQTSTPISSQQIPILTNNGHHLNNNLRTNQCLNMSSNCNMLINTNYPNNMMVNMQQSYLNNMNIPTSRDLSTNVVQQQQQQHYINWKKAKELLDKKERERIGSQLKQADEWLGMVDGCINVNRNNKYQSTKTSTTTTTTTGKQRTSPGSNESRANI